MSCVAFIALRCVLSILSFFRTFNMEGYWSLSKSLSCAYQDDSTILVPEPICIILHLLICISWATLASMNKVNLIMRNNLCHEFSNSICFILSTNCFLKPDRDTLGTEDNIVSVGYYVYFVCAFVLSFCHAWDQIQVFVCVRQVLYYWAISSTIFAFVFF